VAGWDGANRVQHGIRITVRAGLEAAPVVSRLRRLRHRDAAPATAVTGTPIVLSGQMIRLLPDGMVQARAASGRDAGSAAARAAGRRHRVHAALRGPDRRARRPAGRSDRPGHGRSRLAGRAGALGHHSALAHTLTPVALSVHLDRIATPDGYRVGRFAVPGAPGEFVDLQLRADLLADRIVIGSRPNTELRSVFRSQSVASAAGNVGHLRPPSWSGGDLDRGHRPERGGGFGDQSGHNRNAVHGGRGETTLYEQGPATTIAVRVVYHVTLSRFGPTQPANIPNGDTQDDHQRTPKTNTTKRTSGEERNKPQTIKPTTKKQPYRPEEKRKNTNTKTTNEKLNTHENTQ
jgi:hypothetical protein